MKYFARILEIIVLLETIGPQTSQLPHANFLTPAFNCQMDEIDEKTMLCYWTNEIMQASPHHRALSLDKMVYPEHIQTIGIIVPLHRNGLSHDADPSDNTIWRIENPKMFHRFCNLKKINLHHFYVRIDKDLMQDNLKRGELLREFFNLPKLIEIDMSHAIEIEFEFPKSLERLTCQGCHRTNFNLSSNPNLKYVSFQGTYLKKMPKFSQPPPPVKELILQGVDLDRIQFSALHIAHFCKLEKLHVEVLVGATIDNEREYCECSRLQKFCHDFKIKLPGLDSKCDFHTSDIIQSDCAEYPYEELVKKRKEACDLKSSLIISNSLLVIIGLFSIFLLLLIVIVLK